MNLTTGRLYLDKIDQGRVKRDCEGRDYVEVVVIFNNQVDGDGKAGVLQQSTSHGEKRIYLANLFTTQRKGAGHRKLRNIHLEGIVSPEGLKPVERLKSKLFKKYE